MNYPSLNPYSWLKQFLHPSKVILIEFYSISMFISAARVPTVIHETACNPGHPMLIDIFKAIKVKAPGA